MKVFAGIITSKTNTKYNIVFESNTGYANIVRANGALITICKNCSSDEAALIAAKVFIDGQSYY